MPDRPKCGQCGKDAIGFQSVGCCFGHVCGDHAESILLSLKPGEKRVSGECYFERFDASGAVPGR